MQKLLKAYGTDKSFKNARCLRNYALKHPMARCFLNEDELELLAAAVIQAYHGETYG